MAFALDEFAKDVLDVLLCEYGTVDREAHAPALRSQRADLFFVPDPAKDVARRALGLVGAMTAEACFFDPFGDTPREDEAAECLRKTLNHAHASTLRGGVGAKRSWLLCAGRPTRAMDRLGAAPMPRWPRGFYALPPALPMAFVVLPELPSRDDTIALRLLGRSLTQRGAMHDLGRRASAIPHGDALYELVVQAAEAARASRDPLEDSMVDLSRGRELLRQARFEGERLGERRGELQGRLQGKLEGRVEGRLGRALTPEESATLRGHLAAIGVQRATETVLTLPLDALLTWITPPAGP